MILDTRSDAEYQGTFVRAKRGGAVPGAVHIEWTRNLSPSGEFKPAPELKQMYEDAGVTPDREVITYCQGGYRAAHSYIALRLLGYPRVRMAPLTEDARTSPFIPEISSVPFTSFTCSRRAVRGTFTV